jgi:prolyl-tRNA synthetase
VAGANRTGRHLRGVEHGRDFEARFADIREAREGDRCPRCGGKLTFRTAIEVGHIFKLGTYYSEPLAATFLDEAGVERPILMGSYGIGPGRILAAAVEQNHDEQGIAWPAPLAPYDVEVVPIEAAGPQAMETAEHLINRLEQAGLDVLVDDRDRRPGEKFADADLIGCPIRITVGKKTVEDGKVDLLVRAGRVEERVPADDVVERLRGGGA